MSESNENTIIYIVGVLSGLLLSMLIHSITDSQTGLEIVKHTEAYFHPETGAFTWPDQEASE